MKLLLDENLPHELRSLLSPHDVFTVAYMRWGGIKNGQLHTHAAADGFDALLSIDGGIPHQQNTALVPCSVVIIHAEPNAMEHIRPLVPDIHQALNNLQIKMIVHVH